MATVRKVRKVIRRRDSQVVLRVQLPESATVAVSPAPWIAPAMPSEPPPASGPGARPDDARLAPRVWHVCVEGSDPVGPVSADQIARGVRAGKVPSHATVRHEAETFWSDLLDVPDLVDALKRVSTESAPPPPSVSPALLSKDWMIWVDGSEPIGPVSADQIARGIRAGKVPSHASIQRVGELFATDVLDEPDVIAALKSL